MSRLKECFLKVYNKFTANIDSKNEVKTKVLKHLPVCVISVQDNIECQRNILHKTDRKQQHAIIIFVVNLQ
jgi:SPX domain protein involved in polyphosphate accumulation